MTSDGPTSERRGRLLVVSGPSGVGKTTVVEGLLARPGFRRAVTATTRRPREGEQDGVHYHFLDAATFERRVAEDWFLEWADVHGRCYGTPRHEVQRIRDRGETCVLVIDVQGAASLRRSGEDALFVFLEPPSFDELERRLRGRATDGDREIELRLQEARNELARAGEADAVVINEDLDRTIGQIESLVRDGVATRPTRA